MPALPASNLTLNWISIPNRGTSIVLPLPLQLQSTRYGSDTVDFEKAKRGTYYIGVKAFLNSTFSITAIVRSAFHVLPFALLALPLLAFLPSLALLSFVEPACMHPHFTRACCASVARGSFKVLESFAPLRCSSIKPTTPL